MSSNKNDITLSNYEEYFILYMDNELSADGRLMVEAFVSLHPHLAEELESLMSTKLPAVAVSFYNKEELLSSAMKLNAIDEELLLYVDNEVNDAQKTFVEEKIKGDIDYALQHSLLMQTKVDTLEIISYPNKKELYRHTERVGYFPVWMRVAASVIILLFGSLFFLINSNKEAFDTSVVATKLPVSQPSKRNSVAEQKAVTIPQQKEEPVLVKAPPTKKNKTVLSKATVLQGRKIEEAINNATVQNDMAVTRREVSRFDVDRYTNEPDINTIAVNKTIAYTPVTSPVTASYNKQNDPTEPAVNDGDFEIEKKTRAKGFLRKVSRFIQRNTGIGTVNADNELLVGAVALKLK